jgi:F420H(2)-dependent quinone reductase
VSFGLRVALGPLVRRHPSLTRSVGRVHAALLHRTGGRLGARWFGAPTLLLETVGRRTGRRYVTPLVYLAEGGDLVVVPANAGTDRPPSWWLNLRTAGAGVAIVGGRRFAVTATVVEGARRARLWERFAAVSPVEHYQRATSRPLEVVVLTPLAEAGAAVERLASAERRTYAAAAAAAA